MLETILFQQPKSSQVINSDSFVKLWSQIRIEKKGAESVKGGEVEKLYGILGEYAFTPERKKSWKEFVLKIDKASPEDQKQFSRLIVDLGKLGLLQLWLHSSFANNQNIKKLNQEFLQTKPFLEKINEYKQRVEDLSVDGFSQPSKFNKLWQDFQKNILQYFISDDFVKSFKDANDLGKIAAINLMDQFIFKFDLSIKAVTGSTDFVVTKLPDGKNFDEVKNNAKLLKEEIGIKRDKNFTFYLMLEQYFNVLLKRYKAFYGDYFHWSNAASTLKLLRLKTNDSKQLLSREEFDVSAIVAGSTALRGQALFPDTLEEFFQFCHQDLLVIIGKLFLDYSDLRSECPKKMLDIDNKIIKDLQFSSNLAVEGKVSAELIGIDFLKNNILFTYNYPQRNHSARISFSYNLKNKKVILKFVLSGNNTRLYRHLKI